MKRPQHDAMDPGCRGESSHTTVVSADAEGRPLVVHLEVTLPGKAPAQSQGKSESPSSRFIINLTALLFLGIVVLGWVHHYTDAFEFVGSLLALGGILSWVGFVSRVIPDERIKQLQKLAGQYVIDHPRTAPICAGLFLGAFFVANFLGMIEVENMQGGADEFRIARRLGSAWQDGEAQRLPGREPARTLCGTSWWAPTERMVTIPGYPDRRVTVRPFERRNLQVPHAFLRPVVLVKLEATVISNLPDKRRVTLYVRTVQGSGEPREFTRKDYDGQSLWVGCEKMEIPNNLRQGWQKDMDENSELAGKWLSPGLLDEPRPDGLAPNDTVEAWLIRDDGKPEQRELVRTKPIIVPPVQGMADLVKVLELK